MPDFGGHLQEIGGLIQAGIDPVLLYEIKIAGAEGWSDPETLEDLLDPAAEYKFLLDEQERVRFDLSLA